jgi:hypothetical protein
MEAGGVATRAGDVAPVSDDDRSRDETELDPAAPGPPGSEFAQLAHGANVSSRATLRQRQRGVVIGARVAEGAWTRRNFLKGKSTIVEHALDRLGEFTV